MRPKNGIPVARGLRFESVTVTPMLATEWLAKNFERNRTINKSAVQRYAAEMKAGNWKLTHQGIAFDEFGRLIDGQHRLFAVKESGVPVVMLVAYYVDASPLTQIDQGTTRTVGAVLEIDGAVSKGRGSSVSAVCQMLAALVGDRMQSRLTVDQIKQIYDTHRDGIGFAAGLNQSGRLSASFAAAAAYTFPICPQRIESLFRQAVENDGPSKYSGAWHLAALIRQPGVANSKEKRLIAAHSTVKCVELYLADREAKLLRVSVEGTFNGLEWAKRERAKLGLPLGARAEAT